MMFKVMQQTTKKIPRDNKLKCEQRGWIVGIIRKEVNKNISKYLVNHFL